MLTEPMNHGHKAIRRAWRRRANRGSSRVTLVILMLIIALFIFSVAAGTGKGLSEGGCLPTTPAERKALSDKWFSPELPQKEHMSFTCPRVAGELQVKLACGIGIAPSGPHPESYWDKIKAAFEDRPRGLPVKAMDASIKIKVVGRDKGSEAIEATLAQGDTTSISISRAGADVTISCPECSVRIDKR